MIDPLFDEASSELLARAKAAGFPVTHTQLKRWHLSGLLPKPKQIQLGRNLGSETRYPAGAADQLIDLCKRQHAYGKNCKRWTNDDLLWEMWVAGQPIEEEHVRRLLTYEATALDKHFENLKSYISQDGKLILPDEVRADLSKESSSLLRGTILRRMRKRTGKDRFLDFIETLFGILTGSLRGEELRKYENLLEEGLGLRRAKRDWIAGVGPLSKNEIGPDLVFMVGVLWRRTLRELLSDTSWSELNSARNEINSLLTITKQFARFMIPVAGQYAFGLGAFQQFVDLMDNRLHMHMFLGWCALRETSVYSEGLKKIVAGASSTDLSRAHFSYEVLKAIREEFPALQSKLSDQRLKKALSSKSIMSEVTSDLEEFCASNTDSVSKILARTQLKLSTGSKTE